MVTFCPSMTSASAKPGGIFPVLGGSNIDQPSAWRVAVSSDT